MIHDQSIYIRVHNQLICATTNSASLVACNGPEIERLVDYMGPSPTDNPIQSSWIMDWHGSDS